MGSPGLIDVSVPADSGLPRSGEAGAPWTRHCCNVYLLERFGAEAL